MSFESFLTARLNHRLRQRRVLVVSDPDRNQSHGIGRSG